MPCMLGVRLWKKLENFMESYHKYIFIVGIFVDIRDLSCQKNPDIKRALHMKFITRFWLRAVAALLNCGMCIRRPIYNIRSWLQQTLHIVCVRFDCVCRMGLSDGDGDEDGGKIYIYIF